MKFLERVWSEFRLSTLIYVLALIFLIINISNEDYPGNDYHGALADFIKGFLRCSIIYITFLLMHIEILPPLERNQPSFNNAGKLLILFFSIAILLTAIDLFIYTHTDRDNRPALDIMGNNLLIAGFVIGIITLLSLVKIGARYGNMRLNEMAPKQRVISSDLIRIGLLFLLSLTLLAFGEAEKDMIMGWSIIMLFSMAFYALAFHWLIPNALTKIKPFLTYYTRAIVIVLATAIPLWFLLLLITNQPDNSIAYVSVNALIQGVFTIPGIWFFYKRRMKGNDEVQVLKKKLGQSDARLHFLRSQINPHFLFNALNTIYGTAFQEKAGRTAEGIEKLGDMMRFMLHENMQEMIPLDRELEYLENYISLQRLRTDTQPGITIDTEIIPPGKNFTIAPMLLIPFVENAFKHGISFREPSHIRIHLTVHDDTLHFVVENSTHAKQTGDPERDHNGIGLENVRQRLELMYPKNHELRIHQKDAVYYVQLTLQLT